MIVHGETVEQERKKQKLIDDREKKAEYMRKRRAEQREFEQKKAIRRHANKMRMRVKRAADKEIAALALAAEAEPVLPIKDVNYENVPIFDLWHRARAPTVVSTLMKELALGNAAQEVMIAGYINELRKNLIVFPQYGMLAIEDGVVDDGMNVMDTDVESHVDTEEDFDGMESDVMELGQVDSDHDDDDTLSMGSWKATDVESPAPSSSSAPPGAKPADSTPPGWKPEEFQKAKDDSDALVASGFLERVPMYWTCKHGYEVASDRTEVFSVCPHCV